MPITVVWDDEGHTAIRYDITDPWDWPDLLEAFTKDDDLIKSVNHAVHLILNFSESKTAPPDPMSRLKGIAGMVSSQVGLVIIVGASAWFQIVTTIFYKVYGPRTEGMVGLQTVETLEQARVAIAAYSNKRT